MSKVDTSQAYWNNNGKYQEKYEVAWEQFVPASGEAEDGWPEALRAISRIGYDYYNNGFSNLWRMWEEYDCDGSYSDYEMDSYYEDMVDYLRHHIPYEMHKELNAFLLDAQGYGNWSDKAGVIDRIIDHIIENMDHEGMFEEQNIEAE